MNFKLDKENSGFNLEDDEDFGSMLDRVSATAEKDDDDFISSQEPNQRMVNAVNHDETQNTEHYTESHNMEPNNTGPDDPMLQSESQGSNNVENHSNDAANNLDHVEELDKYLNSEPTETNNSTPEDNNENEQKEPDVSVTHSENYQAVNNVDNSRPVSNNAESTKPEQISEPIIKETVKEKSMESSMSRIHVKSEKEQISEISRTLRIVDAYRSLSSDEKTVAIQFVTNGNMTEADDATLAVKVMNCDSLLSPTMSALSQAHELSAVKRAFFILALDEPVLHNLGEMVEVFTGVNYDKTKNNLEYSELLVDAIEQLSDKEISFIKSTEKVLAAAHETD